MTFHETSIHGTFLIELERRNDIRGSFARLWSAAEFRAHGLIADIVDMNTSRTRQRGTIRGLHWQLAPHDEAKFVRCTRGAIYDVVLDMRADSPTRHRWAAFELSAQTDRMIYVPPGCAHGFQTLQDDTEMTYAVSAAYHPSSERGVRWNDPAFAIAWPVAPVIVSEKDASWADFVVADTSDLSPAAAGTGIVAPGLGPSMSSTLLAGSVATERS